MHTAVIKLDNQGDFNCQLSCHPRPRLKSAGDGVGPLLSHPVPTPNSPHQHQSQPEPGGVVRVCVGEVWVRILILTDGLSPRALAQDFSRISHTGGFSSGTRLSFHLPQWRQSGDLDKLVLEPGGLEVSGPC